MVLDISHRRSWIATRLRFTYVIYNRGICAQFMKLLYVLCSCGRSCYYFRSYVEKRSCGCFFYTIKSSPSYGCKVISNE